MEKIHKTGYFLKIFNWVSKHPYLTIVGVSLLLMGPALILGLPLEADDGMAHRRWQLFFAKQLWSGDLYPRWLIDLNDGFGSPAFFIYPPLSHFAAAFFYPILPDNSAIPYRLSFSILLSIILSGIGAYHWIYQVVHERQAAIIGAIFYVISPYHLVVDVYMRGAIAEIWAFAWAPWTLLAIHMFGQRDRRAVLIYVISAVALLFSHAPSSIFLFFTYFIYTVLLTKSYKDIAILQYMLTCTAIATLIAGIYLGTALTHTSYINTRALFEGYFNFFNWLMFSSTRWPSTKAEYAITGTAVTQTLAAISLAVTSLLMLKPKAIVRTMLWFTLLGTLTLFFFMSTWSATFWKIIFPLQKIQFPWRLLMLQSLCLAMLAGCCIHLTSSINCATKKKKVYLLVSFLVTGFFIVNIALYVVTKKSLPVTEIGSSETPEYMLGDVNSLRKLFQPNQKVAILHGQGEVNVLEWTPRHLIIDLNAQTSVKLGIRQFFYPGWQYSTGNSKDYQPVQKLDDDYPILSVNLSEGHHRLDFLLKPTLAERLGTAASLLGCFALIAFMFFLSKQTMVPSIKERRDRFCLERD